jgi:glycosyltransferase involved in cell wall biosynthesis
VAANPGETVYNLRACNPEQNPGKRRSDACMSQSLHLMHVFPSFAPEGAELRVVRIINGIGPKFRHTVLALDEDCRAARHIHTGIRVDFPSPPAGRGDWLYFRALQKAIQHQKPDLLVTYNWGAIDAVVAAVVGRICPVLHNECGFGLDEAAKLKTRRVVFRRAILNRIYATTVTSRTLETICRERFRLNPAKVRWIRTGVDADRLHPQLPRGWRERLGIRGDELLIGYLGALRPEKNLDLLIRAFGQAQIRRSKLVLIGEGPCRQELEAIVRELHLNDAVIFAGHQADPALCLPALDLFALPSKTEQTSNALLEAMACGLPAIATDVGDNRELLGTADAPLIVSPVLDALTEALRALAASPDLRGKIGAENRSRAVASYSNARMTQEYESLYYAAAASLA